jgi:Tol biopolymer transport system component
MKQGIILLLFILALCPATGAQDIPVNHPELAWKTIQTEHFEVHFHNGTERTARVVAKIAEDIYDPVTSLYEYEPDTKIHFIIRDHDDFSNGAAYYYDNKVEIWASPMDFIFRGTHNWLRNVVTHEFSHMISLGAARKLPRSIPAIYFQYLGYEPEKNPYVLYGFPNEIISYPIAATVMPMWLAEGIAQFQMPGLNYDHWDTHRDMILRTSALEGELLDYDEMGVFGHTSLRNEKVYNQGYSLTQFIVDRYGMESLREIANALKSPFRFTVNGALKKAINLSEKELHREWKKHLEEMYAFRTDAIAQNLVTGELLHGDGGASIYPRWSPDGKKIAFISNKGERSIYKTSLYIHDVEANKTKLIKPGVQKAVAWSPDGNQLVYSRLSKATKYFSHFSDIYIYDMNSKKEERITNNLRAISPDWSADGSKIVFVTTHDGTQNLASMRLSEKQLVTLTTFENGEQVYSPRWSPDGRKILFSYSEKKDRKIVTIDADGSDMKVIMQGKGDARDPVYSDDGERIFFAYDGTGIFNIYSMDADGGNMAQLTNVLGGAFMPSVNSEGDVLYCQFKSQKYNISMLDNPSPLDPGTANYANIDGDFHLASANKAAIVPFMKDQEDHPDLSYDDSAVPDYESSSYDRLYSKMSFLPRIMVDYGTTKLGTYFYSSDILNKYSIIGGAAMNKDLDYDLFAIAEYNQFLPTLFVEGYYQTRNHAQKDTLYIQDEFLDYREYTDFNYKYNLLEVDLGLKSYVFNELNSLRFAFVFSRYSAKVKYDLLDQKVSFPYTYFIGRNFSFKYTFSNFVITPYFDSEISPYGKRKVTLTLDQEYNKFFNDFKLTEFGTWSEVYDRYNYTRIGMDWQEFIGLFNSEKHTLNLHFQAGALTKPVHEFFNYFAGGLVGLRGYPYYSIEGRKQLIGRFTYRFPVFDHLNFRLLHLYFDRLYAGAFFDYGNAFNDDKVDFSQFKKNYGFELRLDLFSFYSFPTRLFFNAAYGMDEFIKYERDSELQLKYGKEWRYYLGVTFGYFN